MNVIGMTPKRTQESYIQKMKQIFGDRLDLSNAIYNGVHEQCILRCIEHDITYMQTPHNSFTGNFGCKTCHKNNLSNILKTQEVQDKKRATCMKDYGVPVSSQAPQVKAKAQETADKNGGWAQQRPECKAKTQATLEKRGVSHIMHDPQVAEKQMQNSYKQRKSYTLPSGKEILIQGYEDKMLDILLKDGINESDIHTDRSKQPEIFYADSEGKSHRYYSDAFIESMNTICEAKSLYTLKSQLNINYLKYRACIEAGYKYRFFVFDGRSGRLLSDEEVQTFFSNMA